MSVPGCITGLFLLGDMLRCCHRNHFLHDFITQVFLQSVQYGIVVLGFLDAFVYAHLKHRPGSENPGNFGDCMKGRIRSLYDGHHSRLLPRISGNVSCPTHTCGPAPKLPAAQAQSQISKTSQCLFHNT